MIEAAPATTPSPSPMRTKPRIGPAWLVALLLLGYFVGAGLLATQTPCDNDFGGIFLPSARYVVAGQPLEMYHVRIGLYPNANGPLGEVLMAGALATGRALGLQHVHPLCGRADSYPLPGDSIPLRIWITLLFALFPLAIGREILRLADKYLPEPFTGWRRLVAWVLLLAAPCLWDSMIFYGHFEQVVELLLALLAARFVTEERSAVAGALLGLALLNRTAGIFVVIPLALVLLAERRIWQMARLALTTGITLGIGLLPFYLRAKADLLYSLSTFRAQEPILDGSFWSFFRGTVWEASLQSWDSTVAITLALGMSAVLIWGGKVRQVDDPRLYLVVAASLVCFCVGLKATWSYYFTEPLYWGMAWMFTQPWRRWPWLWYAALPVFFTVLLIVTEARISLVGDTVFAETGATRALTLVLSAVCAGALLVFDGAIIAVVTNRAGTLVLNGLRSGSHLYARLYGWYNKRRTSDFPT